LNRPYKLNFNPTLSDPVIGQESFLILPLVVLAKNCVFGKQFVFPLYWLLENLRDPFLLTYGVSLPSSLERFKPCALVYSTYPLVLVLVQFLAFLPKGQKNQIFCPLVFPGFGTYLKDIFCSIEQKKPIGLAVRHIFTLGADWPRLYYNEVWKPWIYGGFVSYKTFCYSCVHCHFWFFFVFLRKLKLLKQKVLLPLFILFFREKQKRIKFWWDPLATLIIGHPQH